MKLFYSQTSPYVRKVMVVAIEVGLADRIEKLPSKVSPINRDASVAINNPLGKVPAMVLDDGSVLYDSRVIAEYVDHIGGGSFFPKPGPARWQALTAQALADGLLDAGLLVRYERTMRPPEQQSTPWVNGQMDKITSALASIEATAPSLGLDIGAVAIACALGYLDFRFADLGWKARHPKAAAWYAEFSKRPSMQATPPE